MFETMVLCLLLLSVLAKVLGNLCGNSHWKGEKGTNFFFLRKKKTNKLKIVFVFTILCPFNLV